MRPMTTLRNTLHAVSLRTNGALITLLLLLALGLTGCGGGNKSTPQTTGAGRGTLQFTVKWPDLPSSGRLIPVWGNAIQITVTKVSDGSPATAPVVLRRPDTTANLAGLDPGDVTITASAFFSPDGTTLPPPAMSSGKVRVRVIADQVVPTTLVMDSTITKVEVAPTSTVKIKKGTETLFTATARDANNAVVLTESRRWQWASSNTTVTALSTGSGVSDAPVSTSTAGFKGLIEGDAVITATEAESGVSGQVSITVPTRYALTPLGTFAGGQESYGFGLNEMGQAVGWAEEGTRTRPFLWQPTAPNATTGALVNLDPSGTFDAVAYAINTRGQVTGYFYNTAAYQGILLWSPSAPNISNGTIQNLQSQLRPGFTGSGFAINDQGAISGIAFSSNPATNPGSAIRWQPDAPNGSTGTFTYLGDLFRSDINVYSAGYAITASGLVYGATANILNLTPGSFTAQTTRQAFVWSQGSTGGATLNPQMRALASFGNPANPGTFFDTAFAAKETGTELLVAGMALTTSGTRHATLWKASTAGGPYTATDLGSQEFAESVAYGVNRQGQVVGTVGYAISAPVYAVLWENGQMISLSDTIPASSGVLLLEARGINDAGQIICAGRDLATGKQRAYLLTPN